MKLYESVIDECMELLSSYKPVKLDVSSNWPDVGRDNLVLKSDMAYELGGGWEKAVSAFAFTSDSDFCEDEVLLYGDDLGKIKENTSYARLTFIAVDDNTFSENESVDKSYALMRKIEYTRYHINPKGYMMRISVTAGREAVRVSKEAIEKGISFSDVAGLFLAGYHKNPQVKAVKMVFVTIPDAPYDRFEKISGKAQMITGSLNHILTGVSMDCGTCGYKPVCDEVEELKKLHTGI